LLSLPLLTLLPRFIVAAFKSIKITEVQAAVRNTTYQKAAAIVSVVCQEQKITHLFVPVTRKIKRYIVQ